MISEESIVEGESEPILSPELVEELGNDASDVVLVGKKKKRTKNENEVSEEVKTLAKQLSKNAQKRIAQITLRKEKEAKCSDFLNVIHEHEISDEHRQLLTSTRNINQTQTMKQLLSSLYRKQAAGLTLTAEESQVLYNQPNDPSLVIESASLPASFLQQETVVDSTLPVQYPEEPSISLDELFPSFAPNTTPSQVRAKKSKKKKSTTQEDTATSTTTTEDQKTNHTIKRDTEKTFQPDVIQANNTTQSVSSTSVGSGLLAQLQLLKANKSATSGNKSSTINNTSIANQDEDDHIETEKKPVYVVQEVVAPITAQGEITKPTTTSNTSTDIAQEKVSISSKSAHDSASSGATMEEGEKKSISVKVMRSAVVQAARMELPVCGMEQEIVEAVNNAENDAIILCGETGSGKSTQVPQFLYEAGYAEGGLIGITQPRRVAVTSTAERVAFEMTSGMLEQENKNNKKNKKKTKNNLTNNTTTSTTSTTTNETTGRLGQLVGYQIRFDSSTVGSNTRIKFMTDGILLKEVSQDLLLKKYNVIILDEAHERNMNTDVLLGMLSKVLPLRRIQSDIEYKKYNLLTNIEKLKYNLPIKPLKLIIMSATMRVNDFQNPILFPLKPPPIINVEARQYSVTTHFSKRTECKNYLKETYKKICQIHKKLPEGGVLVFLSGKQEILYMCHKLSKALNKKTNHNTTSTTTNTGTTTSDNEIDNNSNNNIIEIVGLGASKEELMEQQEDSTADLFLSCLNSSNHNDVSNKNKSYNKRQKKGTATAAGEKKSKESVGPSMKELLQQDEIITDSENEEDQISPDSDDDNISISSNNQINEENPPITTTTPITEEEKIFILDGDENSDLIQKTTTEKQNLRSKIDSSKNSLTTGDSIRDQYLREALGIDPNLINGNNLVTNDNNNDEIKDKNDQNISTNQPETSAINDGVENGVEEAPALKAWILPLYAMMPAAQQNRVFQPPPPGYRLIVVATNVAETSITIPGIRYVVDSGRQKEKVLTSATSTSTEEEDANNTTGNKRSFEGTKVVSNDITHVNNGNIGAGIAKYEVKWVSQAAAMQRQGRAGRTGPGHCYRLYSANFFHQYLQPYQPPEITLTPLEELILQMKALGIDHIERFPFPTPPPQQAIRNAMALLTNLGALAPPGSSSIIPLTDGSNKTASGVVGMQDLTAAIAMATMTAMKSKSALHQRQLEQLQELHHQQQLVRELSPLTPLGKILARFPLNPRFAKMLVMAFKASGIRSIEFITTSSSSDRNRMREKLTLLSHALTLVATLAERSAFEGSADRIPSSNSTRKKSKLSIENSTGSTLPGDESGSDSDSADEDAIENARQSEGILFHHEDGDALARLRASGAYIHTVTTQLQLQQTSSRNNNGNNNHRKPNKAEIVAANESASVKSLCSVHHLHIPTLQRIVELREQLQDLSTSVLLTNPNSSNSTSTMKANIVEDETERKTMLNVPLQPPSSAQELALRQLIVSGFCDSIARRVPLGVIKTGARRRRLTAYYSSHPSLQEVPLYLHPGSNLYRKDPTATLPEFVSYGSLVRNQRGDCIYMACVTTVAPTWLASVAADSPLLKWSTPLTTPTPYYDPALDTVMCFVTPRFGVHNWELPAMRRSLYDCTALTPVGEAAASNTLSSTPLGYRKQDEAYRWFAKLLLEGAIFPSGSTIVSSNCARELRSVLGKNKLKDASAAIIIQMKPLPKVSNLLRKLVTRDVHTVAALQEQLRLDSSYILDEILEFLLPEVRKDFRSVWHKFAATSATNSSSGGSKK